MDEENIIVEFILPRDLLDQPVEQWTDEFDDLLGMRLPVVVRYRERLRERGKQFGLKDCWDAYKTPRCRAANLSCHRQNDLLHDLES